MKRDIRWYHYFCFSFIGTEELVFRCPLFLLILSYGAKEWNRQIYWWGFLFCWKKVSNPKEGDLLFQKEYKFVFREYSYYEAYIRGGCPL